MIGSHDRQETDAQMQLGIRAIQIAKVRYDGLVEQLPPPESGSMLDTERQYTAREPLDILVMTHRARARENLDRVFAMMIDHENEQLVAFPFSLYSLIRTAVEAAAMSMWLIQSSKKADRVFRALQVAYRSSHEAVMFAELIKGTHGAAPARVGHAKTVARLNELKDMVGPLRQRELGYPPRYTSILTAVSPKARDQIGGGYELSSPLVVWKSSSAFLHGSGHVVRALSDIRQIDDFNEGVASFEITPSIQMLAVSIGACVDLIAQLDERYLYLSIRDYAGRSVAL